MPWIQAGVAVGGALLSSAGGDDKSWKGEADKAGINRAATEAQTARAFEALPVRARAIESQATLAQVEIERNASSAEADAIVSAATAGVTGGSVDATQQDIQRSAGEATRQIERERSAGQTQIEQEYDDIFWEGDAAKYQYSYRGAKGSAGKGFLTAALSGVGAYAGAGGFKARLPPGTT